MKKGTIISHYKIPEKPEKVTILYLLNTYLFAGDESKNLPITGRDCFRRPRDLSRSGKAAEVKGGDEFQNAKSSVSNLQKQRYFFNSETFYQRYTCVPKHFDAQAQVNSYAQIMPSAFELTNANLHIVLLLFEKSGITSVSDRIIERIVLEFSKFVSGTLGKKGEHRVNFFSSTISRNLLMKLYGENTSTFNNTSSAKL